MFAHSRAARIAEKKEEKKIPRELVVVDGFLFFFLFFLTMHTQYLVGNVF